MCLVFVRLYTSCVNVMFLLWHLWFRFLFREAFTTSVYNSLPRTEQYIIRVPVTDNVEYSIKDIDNPDQIGIDVLKIRMTTSIHESDAYKFTN